jgi:hypothetical protein
MMVWRTMGLWLIVGLFTPAFAQVDQRFVEVVATSRHEAQAWRYTFDKPAAEWPSASFDERGWQSGRGPFGTRGTPGVSANTEWATRDIWLRREVAMPAQLDLAALRLLVFHDEDVEIYFDGVLAARAGGFVRDYEPMEIAP